MCNPMLIMAGVAMAGSIKGGMDAQEQKETEATELGYQSAQDRADADAERGAAEVRAGKLRKAGLGQQSTVRSAFAKSGVVADAGSAVAIQDSVIAGSEEDALMEIITGKYRAQKLEIRANTLDRQAGYTRQAGEAAMTAGIMGAGKSLLGAYGGGSSGFMGGVKSGWSVQS